MTQRINGLQNPITPAITQLFQDLRSLRWTGMHLFASPITAVVFSVVLLLLLILWPYGIIPVVAGELWQFVKDDLDRAKGTKIIESMPYVVAAGILFLVWSVFGVLSLPFVIIGLIGRMFSTKKKTRGRKG